MAIFVSEIDVGISLHLEELCVSFIINIIRHLQRLMKMSAEICELKAMQGVINFCLKRALRLM